MEFLGTKGKYDNGWGVYFGRHIGELGVEDITIMPSGNRNSNELIATCWDKRKIGANGGLKYEDALLNAQLIAHAPQLLEMLNTLLTAIDNAELTDDDTEAIVPLMAKAEDLIKQATTINK